MKLSLAGVGKRYGGHWAVNHVTVEIECRSLVLLGRSGSGKTTLLRLIGGLETLDIGNIAMDGRELPISERELIAYRRRVATVFQAYNLFPHLSALENLTLPLEKVHEKSPAQAREIALIHLARLGLEAHAEKRPAQLSGGQKQRVAIARALSIEPELILFDEPTSALDPEMTAEVLDVIEQLRTEGRNLVLVTHQIAFARRVADTALFLEDGHLIECGTAAALFEKPQSTQLTTFLQKVLRY